MFVWNGMAPSCFGHKGVTFNAENDRPALIPAASKVI